MTLFNDIMKSVNEYSRKKEYEKRYSLVIKRRYLLGNLRGKTFDATTVIHGFNNFVETLRLTEETCLKNIIVFDRQVKNAYRIDNITFEEIDDGKKINKN